MTIGSEKGVSCPKPSPTHKLNSPKAGKGLQGERKGDEMEEQGAGFQPCFSRLCDLESVIWVLEASLLSPIISG